MCIFFTSKHIQCSVLIIFLHNSQGLVENILLHFLDSFSDLMEKFQLALCRHQSGGQSLYRSKEMQAFFETHAPHLFNILIKALTSADGCATSESYSHLLQQRTVALLHCQFTLGIKFRKSAPVKFYCMCLKYGHSKNKKL